MPPALEIPSTARILIIDGVAGAGKGTLAAQLKSILQHKIIYFYSEEELLFSWKHAWIPEIDAIRIDFMMQFLNHCEKVLKEDHNAVMILDRFHLSFITIATILSGKKKLSKTLEEKYATLITRLQKLPVHVYVPLLQREEIEARSAHKEREDPAWQLHLKRRLIASGYPNFTELYLATQTLMEQVLKEQKIPYTLLQSFLNTH